MQQHQTLAPDHATTPPPRTTMMDAIAQAKVAIAAMTLLPIDSISQCTKGATDTWTITVDVIESPARMGDNDLIASYAVEIGYDGELIAFSRTRRYHREDRES